ncbi:hypothetical protein DID88_007375 [Monilinia fructigena]|uniref:Uncharacterized protein n=1 Tax=Monilinia fructigena TaxID=38457 RepID=A0A395J8V2_9HELO|nr:hypothetical protein DID88_007375 [Monilinia fructigena]
MALEEEQDTEACTLDVTSLFKNSLAPPRTNYNFAPLALLVFFSLSLRSLLKNLPTWTLGNNIGKLHTTLQPLMSRLMTLYPLTNLSLQR